MAERNRVRCAVLVNSEDDDASVESSYVFRPDEYEEVRWSTRKARKHKEHDRDSRPYSHSQRTSTPTRPLSSKLREPRLPQTPKRQADIDDELYEHYANEEVDCCLHKKRKVLVDEVDSDEDHPAMKKKRVYPCLEREAQRKSREPKNDHIPSCSDTKDDNYYFTDEPYFLNDQPKDFVKATFSFTKRYCDEPERDSYQPRKTEPENDPYCYQPFKEPEDRFYYKSDQPTRHYQYFNESDDRYYQSRREPQGGYYLPRTEPAGRDYQIESEQQYYKDTEAPTFVPRSQTGAPSQCYCGQHIDERAKDPCTKYVGLVLCLSCTGIIIIAVFVTLFVLFYKQIVF